MLTIGLGKQKGADTYHQAVFNYGFPRVIFSVARAVIKNSKILFGVGSVEDAYAQTAVIKVMLPRDFEAEEKELLKTAKKLSAKLPFDYADILIIDEMGKEISGAGFDTKIVGRIGLPLKTKEPEKPKIKRIIVCDLTDTSEGNAAGVANADLITQKLYDKMDANITMMNCLTSGDPEAIKIPLPLKNDREAIETAMKCVGLIALEDLKIIRIKNTLRIEEVEVSTAYKNELKDRKDLELIRKEKNFAFDKHGSLRPF